MREFEHLNDLLKQVLLFEIVQQALLWEIELELEELSLLIIFFEVLQDKIPQSYLYRIDFEL